MLLASLFGLGSPPPTAGTIPPAAGSGLTGVVLNPGQWSAAIRALQTIEKGRTLSIPKILVHNHQQARLDSVLQQPYASTNASTTVATTSYGGSLDAGTILTVKPHLTEADHLQLEYTVTLSSFVGAAQENLPPPRQQSSIQSQVTIPDGYTVVLGGLDITTDSETRSQLPILGDIPLLGLLFRNTTTTKTKTRFFVFLRASVMRDARFEDLRFQSDKDLRDFDLPENGPPVEPRLLR
jgi:general secretion pathway protein D